MISSATFPLPILPAPEQSSNPQPAEPIHLSVVTDEPGKESINLEDSLSEALAELKSAEKPADIVAEQLHIVGEMLANLAERHIRRGDTAKAEVLYLRAIQVLRSALAPEHPMIALTRDNLAGLYKARRQYALAESLQRTALADLKKYYSEPHADIAITMCNLADTCMLTGRTEDARTLLTDGLAILKSLFGNDDPEVTKQMKHLEDALHRRERAMAHHRPRRGHHRHTEN